MANANNDSGAQVSSEVNRIAVKVPPFWPEKPSLWFSQLEGQFELARITSDSTKFYYVISNLNNNVALEVEDVITNPPASDMYRKLKTEIIKRLSTSQEQRIKQLLEHEEIGSRTPSQFLRHLRNLAGNAIPDSFLKTLWLSRLPPPMQAILATQVSANLSEIAELADKIKEVSPHLQVSQISSDSQIQQLAGEMRQLQLQIAELTRRQQDRRTPGRFRYRRRSSSRASTSERRSDGETECWYHRRFSDKAKKCSPPCRRTENDNRH